MKPTPHLVILAGGASSRLWPLREKSLLKFGDTPLLLSQLRTYATLGFTHVVIIGNPHNEATIRELMAQLPPSLHADFAQQPEPKGMGDALLRAEPFVPAGSAIYVNQVHDVVDIALHEAVLRMFASNPKTTYICGVEMARYFPGGYLIIDESGMISGIKEKPGAGNEPSRYVNIVAHCHADASALFDALRHEYAQDTPTDDHYERAMDALMKRTPYRLVPYTGAWHALKYAWHVLDVMGYFLGKLDGQAISDQAYIHPHASISGNVVIEAGAKVFAGAAIAGPAYIGKGVIVGNNALVRASMVLDGANVGFTSEVARSYVADGCQLHACRVLDSVFAPNVNFSAGCTTANLRIDKGDVPSVVKGQRLLSGRDKLGAIVGQDAFLGVDVMTMPGVKIGERAQIGPGTHVMHDVKDGARLYVKQTQVLEEGE